MWTVLRKISSPKWWTNCSTTETKTWMLSSPVCEWIERGGRGRREGRGGRRGRGRDRERERERERKDGGGEREEKGREGELWIKVA